MKKQRLTIMAVLKLVSKTVSSCNPTLSSIIHFQCRLLQTIEIFYLPLSVDLNCNVSPFAPSNVVSFDVLKIDNKHIVVVWHKNLLMHNLKLFSLSTRLDSCFLVCLRVLPLLSIFFQSLFR